MWGEPVDGKFSNYGYGLILFDRGEIRIKGKERTKDFARG